MTHGSSDEAQAGRLTLDEDMAFQHKTWRVQRIAWVVMAGLVAAGLLGLFSRGPLSSDEARNAKGDLTVKFDFFERYEGASGFEIRGVAGPDETTITLRLGAAFLDAYTVRGIAPPPVSSTAAAGNWDAAFNVAPGAAFAIHIDARARTAGLVAIAVGATGRDQVTFRQFIYP